MPKTKQAFTPEDLKVAMAKLGMLDFFPPEPATRAAIMMLLGKMVPHKRALEWLVNELINHVGKWPGPAEVRGILCSRFDPADGIDHWSTLPGYSAADGEAKFLLDHDRQKQAERLEGEGLALIRQLATKVKTIQ